VIRSLLRSVAAGRFGYAYVYTRAIRALLSISRHNGRTGSNYHWEWGIRVVAPLTSDDARTIGPYQLLRQLGRGSLGDVFLGRSASGETVALKVIRPELAGDPWFRDQFRAEVTAARTVGGAFVTPVVDADLDGDVPWLAAAYVEGPTLAEAVREHGPVPAQALAMLASGLAEGLAAIHAAGVVHGNLHPGNVLLAEDGPRVADFGIARAAVASGLQGADYGWPGFLSPEQALGDDAGPPSDIFGLGAVLTFACTGHGPFGSGTSAALMYRLVNSPAELGDLPGELRALVGSCLAKQPASRPAAGRLVAEFGVLRLDGDGRSGPLVAGAGAEPGALALAGAAAATVTAGAAAGGSAAEPWPGGEPDGRRGSRRRGSRPSAAPWLAGGVLAVSAGVIVIMTGAVPLSSAGQSHGGAALAGPASTSQAPASGTSPSVSAGSVPSAQRTGQSGGITPAVQEGPSASAFLSPAVTAAVPPGSSAAASPASSKSASASASPSKSPSPSASSSASPSPSPSSSPSSTAPATPPPSSTAPSTPPPSSTAPATPPPSSSLASSG
jgi:Protein kinase domain